MQILAIDPGPQHSAWVSYNAETQTIQRKGWWWNHDVMNLFLRGEGEPTVVIEGVESFGMPVGKDVFQTCIWIGRFMQAHNPLGLQPAEARLLYRSQIKMALCGTTRAKDANIRQALIDQFPATGGGKTPQIGTKKQPGPLHGMRSHLWSALAVAVVFAEFPF